MTVYLIHFDRPFSHATHYLGYTLCEDTLDARLEHHLKGTGARLLKRVNEADIPWRLARVWPNGDQSWERRLKQHGKSRICPCCAGAQALRRGRELPSYVAVLGRKVPIR